MLKLNYFEISSIPTVDAKKVLATMEEDELIPGRKRRRLDNLNVDERILRRKLKNRVAAQTARDRKKVHMDDLEVTLGRLEKENKFLKRSNEELRSQVYQLSKSNLQLHERLGSTPSPPPSQNHTCLTANNNQHQIITPSVSDHDHIVIKKEELSTEHAVDSNVNSCFINHDMQEESKTVLLLDVIGNEEPVTVKTTTAKPPQETTRLKAVNETAHQIEPTTNIKCEEFDVDDITDATCPSSPESLPLSPSSSEDNNELDDIIRMYTSTNNGMVGDTTYNGCGVIENKFIDDEFLLSCAADIPNNCCIIDTNDPFSELFPSLVSV